MEGGRNLCFSRFYSAEIACALNFLHENGKTVRFVVFCVILELFDVIVVVIVDIVILCCC